MNQPRQALPVAVVAPQLFGRKSKKESMDTVKLSETANADSVNNGQQQRRSKQEVIRPDLNNLRTETDEKTLIDTLSGPPQQSVSKQSGRSVHVSAFNQV